jgi:hypothetical protein
MVLKSQLSEGSMQEASAFAGASAFVKTTAGQVGGQGRQRALRKQYRY